MQHSLFNYDPSKKKITFKAVRMKGKNKEIIYFSAYTLEEAKLLYPDFIINRLNTNVTHSNTYL